MKTIKDAVKEFNGVWPYSQHRSILALIDEGLGGISWTTSATHKDKICTRKEFEDYAKEQKQNDKPVYTQEMADNGELPPVGISCMFKHQSEDNIMFDDCFIVGYSKCGKFIIFHNHQNQIMQHNIVNGPYRFKPIDTRTDEDFPSIHLNGACSKMN